MVPRGWIMRQKQLVETLKASFSMHSLNKWCSLGLLWRRSQFFRHPEAVSAENHLKMKINPIRFTLSVKRKKLKCCKAFVLHKTSFFFFVMVGGAPNPGWSFLQQPEHEKETLMLQENKRLAFHLKYLCYRQYLARLFYSPSFNVVCCLTARMATV